MSDYTRTQGGPIDRDPTIPRFHMEAVLNQVASDNAGRPIFDSQERVQFIQPGSPHSPVFLVADEHRQRWPEQYAQFKAGLEFSVTGTPLEQWPFLRKTNVMELKAIGIHTVEQCAALSDVALQRIGMGGRTIRENALAYLDEAKACSIVSQAIADREKAENANASLTKQVDELRAIVDRLTAQMTVSRDTPPAAETYVPPASFQLPQESASGVSSLDSLQSARTPRRRAEAPA